MRFVRRTEDEYADKFHKCDVCGFRIRLGTAPEGGRYEPPSPPIATASFYVFGGCAIQLAGTSTALSDGSDAPSESPSRPNIVPVPGQLMVFAASGHLGTAATVEGDTGSIATMAEANSIAGLIAPNYGLCGVFLADSAASGAAPAALDFTLEATRNYTSLAPALAQPFFIGIGKYESGSVTYYRQVMVPTGATRLFLGCHAASGWKAIEGMARGCVWQATKFTHVSKFQASESGYGTVVLTDRAHMQGCPACGSPAWNYGGKPGDLMRTRK